MEWRFLASASAAALAGLPVSVMGIWDSGKI